MTDPVGLHISAGVRVTLGQPSRGLLTAPDGELAVHVIAQDGPLAIIENGCSDGLPATVSPPPGGAQGTLAPGLTTLPLSAAAGGWILGLQAFHLSADTATLARAFALVVTAEQVQDEEIEFVGQLIVRELR
jgi:hypothetical protein